KSSTPIERSRRIAVKAGADLQKAINDAKPGDTLVLEAGATYPGPIKLPRKDGTGWITVQSSALESGLPPAGTRVSPANAAAMPKITTAGQNEPALRTVAGAHHFRFVGIEFAPASAEAKVGDLIRLGEVSGQTSLEQVPHHLVFDRCYIHALPGAALKRGIALNSAETEVINSYVADFKAKGQDAQAICGWNGPGPFKIINNYLEGSGENVMFGGDWPRINNLVPSDIEVRGNHFAKPLEWRGVWSVKNLFEIKNARRVVIDGNLFEYNWKDAQTGIAILFKSNNAGGKAPWSVCEDVQFTNNVVRHVGGGISILARDYHNPSEQAKRITVRNNLFEDVGGEWGGGRFLSVSGGPDTIVFDHNTIFQTFNLITASGEKPVTNFVWTNNVAPHNKYGIKGQSTPSGNETLAQFFPGAVFKGNVIAGAKKSLYPADNFYPATLAEIGLGDRASGETSARAKTAAKFKGTDGKEVGCDLQSLAPAFASVRPSENTQAQK
ncbi:MAG TPA: hypothetical protein VM870_02575, partial [Pyrinomonadaceae bacterium]|nr:hypothetical protein [Pyrinomonadaceae bacterium]